MNRRGLTAVAGIFIAVPLALAACGDDGGGAADTLPPILTTTSTTIQITTTTEWVPITYEIQPGDRLADIAAEFGVDIDRLALLNGITDHDDIEAGAVLQIPPPTVPTTIPPETTTTTTLAATTTTS